MSGEGTCRAAVMRAYWQLKRFDVPDVNAFNAAARIYRHYHPDALGQQARFAVAEWLDEAG